MHAYIHTYIHTNIHTYIHACIHTYMHAYIHTYIHTYIHAYIHTYLLLISMLWHRQAIFESKGDKLSSTAECRIRTHQGLRHQIASRLNARWQTDWAIEDQAKKHTYIHTYVRQCHQRQHHQHHDQHQHKSTFWNIRAKPNLIKYDKLVFTGTRQAGFMRRATKLR